MPVGVDSAGWTAFHYSLSETSLKLSCNYNPANEVHTREEDEGVHGVDGAGHLLLLVLGPVLVVCSGTAGRGDAE